ncbi:MAG: undecaprenyl-phosphate glucose phosphotransferase [Oscillospiraceae bacterium]
MIKENQKLLNRLNVFSDVAISFLAIVISYLFVFRLLEFEKNYPLTDYLKLLVFFIPIQLLTYGCLGLYDSFRTSTLGKEISKIFQAFLIDGVTLIAVLYVIKIINFSRWTLALFLLLDMLLIAIKRVILRQSLKHFRSSGYNKKHVVIIGGGDTAAHYLRTIRREKHMGFECSGYVSDSDTLDAQRLGGYDDILRILDGHSYSEVVCALDSDDMRYLDCAVEACEQTGTKISVIPAIYKYMSATPAIDMVGDIPVMNIRRIPLDNVGNAFMKRAMDIIGSLILLVLTAPIMLVSAIIIKLTMGGKVIFRQQRVGLNKQLFTMYKLKSMKDNLTSDTAWSTDNDPRKTRFGSFIRKFSIDELPQLFNVLKGDMSLVGPRPEIPFHVDNFKQSIPMYMIKHQVKPGMTGLAQVNGFRGDTSIKRRIEYDIEYIENWNIFLDISILIRTVFSGFINKEKIKKNITKPEKYLMINKKEKPDYLALAIFLPSIIALAIIPVILKITALVTKDIETYRLFGGSFDSTAGVFYLTDMSNIGKASAICIIAIIMLAVALICCWYVFRNAEKRMFIYTGLSVVFVLMSFMSAMGSDFRQVAFNGVYGRMEGFYVTASYFVMFLFTMYAFRKTQNFKYVVIALSICTAINFIIGICQYTGNNLLLSDWFRAIVTDGKYRDMVSFNIDAASEKGRMYGALYHYNYVGSFMGLIIPMFAVLAISGKTILQKLLYSVITAAALFMLLASTARSGLVAIAVSAVLGLVVFARVLIRHWKATVSVAAAGVVLVVGANFALDNALFSRIPSLFRDVYAFIAPAEQTDLFDTLPVRDIIHNTDGSVTFKTQTDEINIRFDADMLEYKFTDKNGDKLTLRYDENNLISIANKGFEGVNFEFASSDNNPNYNDSFFMWFTGSDKKALIFSLFNEKQIHMIHPDIGDRITPQNAEAIGFKGKELLGSSRGYIWSRTIPLLKNCMLTGYGPDTFAYVFPQNDYLAKYYAYDEGFYLTVDKPHNLYLQIFFSNGLIALIAFVAICALYLIDSLRLYALKDKYRPEQFYGISVMLGIVGYLAAVMFNDSVVSVAPVFWIMLGIGTALNAINRRTDKSLAGVAQDTTGVRVSKRRQKANQEEDEKAARLAAVLGAKRDAAAAAANIMNSLDEAEISRIAKELSEHPDKASEIASALAQTNSNAVAAAADEAPSPTTAPETAAAPEAVSVPAPADEDDSGDPSALFKKIIDDKKRAKEAGKSEVDFSREDAQELYRMVHKFTGNYAKNKEDDNDKG